MIRCPVCSHNNQSENDICENCKCDLVEYKNLVFAPDILYNRAIDAIKHKDSEKAKKYLIYALEISPKDTGIMNFLVRLYLSTKEYTSAMNYMVEILAITPDDERTIELMNEVSKRISRQDIEKKQFDEFMNMSFADYYKMLTGNEFSIDTLCTTK